MKGTPGWRTAPGEWAHEYEQGILQSYAVVNWEYAWRDRHGVRNEARKEAEISW